jgi:threonine/homoserine/homoserine lactone efflux protein
MFITGIFNFATEGGKTINGLLLLKGIFIGMFVCIPIGPLGFLSVQRTIKKGRMIGFLSGMGAALADLIFASFAIFGISFIDEILAKYDRIITFCSGILFIVMGAYIIIKSKTNNKVVKDIKENQKNKSRAANTVASTFIMGLSNPMTFFVFLAIFARMEINVTPDELVNNIGFVLSIFIGSCILWIIVTNIIKLSKKGLGFKAVMFMDEAIGILICLFGIFDLLKGIMKF